MRPVCDFAHTRATSRRESPDLGVMRTQEQGGASAGPYPKRKLNEKVARFRAGLYVAGVCLCLGRFRAFVELSVRPWSVREFLVERLPILDTAAQKLRPVRNGEVFRNRLWQKVPKLWMMPTQIVTAAVAMGANSRAQPDHLGDQFLPCQVGKIIVHRHHQR